MKLTESVYIYTRVTIVVVGIIGWVRMSQAVTWNGIDVIISGE